MDTVEKQMRATQSGSNIDSLQGSASRARQRLLSKIGITRVACPTLLLHSSSDTRARLQRSRIWSRGCTGTACRSRP